MSDDISVSRPVTTRDVALKAGVAQSTVSRALNNNPQISDGERKRILAIAEELGYRPNPFVSAFTAQVRSYRRSPKGATIALLDSSAEGETSFGSSYRRGAELRAQSLGYRTEIFRLKDIDGSIERLNKILHARNTYGLLVLPVSQSCDLSKLRMDNLATATVDYTLRQPDLSRACPDYFQGMVLALRELWALGYRRICFCARSVEVTVISPHWLGAYTGWRELLPPSDRVECYTHPVWDKRHFQKWLKHTKPDAIITNSDHFFRWASEIKLRHPKVAFAALFQQETPTFFQVDQNPLQVGAAAIDLIIGQIHRNERGVPAAPKTVLIKSSWVNTLADKSGKKTASAK